jgi:hypothetical protein
VPGPGWRSEKAAGADPAKAIAGERGDRPGRGRFSLCRNAHHREGAQSGGGDAKEWAA